MTTIDKYLDELQNQESIFPMDSIHTGKLPNKSVIYGDEEKEEDDIKNKYKIES